MEIPEKTEQQDYHVNLDDLDEGLVEESIDIDPDVDPMAGPPPIDDGTYRVKLILDDKSWEEKTTRPNRDGETRSYIGCKFSGAVIAEGSRFNNNRVFLRVNTLTFEGKSEMGWIFYQLLGGAANPEAAAYIRTLKNHRTLAKEFRKALLSEPTIRVKTQWQVSAKNDKDKWKTVLAGQKKFNKKPDGSFDPKVTLKDGTDRTAQVAIVEWLPDVA